MKNFCDLEDDIIQNDLCTKCGTCIGICPVGAIDYKDNRIKCDTDKCISCGKCYRVCPGKEFDMNQYSLDIFQCRYNVKEPLGFYTSIYNMSSSDNTIREAGTSGGIVTQLLCELLKSNQIEGAAVVRQSTEKPDSFEPCIATNESEILSAAQSKYQIIPTNCILKEIKKKKRKVAVVALPCQVQGLRKAIREDFSLKEYIVVIISLFCGFNMKQEATDYLINKSSINKRDIVELKYRKKILSKTGFYVKDNKQNEFFLDKHSYTFMNLLFSPKRCWKCYDYSGEFADISVGDAWEMGQGWSRLVVRTTVGKKIVNQLIKGDSVCIRKATLQHILDTQKSVLTYKKQGIVLRKKFMKYFPEYGIVFPSISLGESIKSSVLFSVLVFFNTSLGEKVLKILPFKLLTKISASLKKREIE